MRRLVCLGLAALLALPAAGLAATPEEVAIQELQQKIQQLSAALESLSKQVEESKKPAAAQPAQAAQPEIKELAKRLDAVEKHSVLDRISLSGDLRVKADSLVYKGITTNQGMMVDFDRFWGDTMAGAFGNPFDPTGSAPIQQLFNKYPDLMNSIMKTKGFAGFDAFGRPIFTNGGAKLGKNMFGDGPTKYDADNSILYTTRLRLNMKAKVWDNVNFSGRLNMYKNWGDSTGVQVFDSFDSFTMDGTNSGNTTGDLLHVERAYFDWNSIGGTPFYLSIGRRPSTYGPPTEFRENELRGGTPSGHLVNFNFDGITLGYGLEDATGIDGMVARLCYGQGFESEYGNGSLFAETDLDDTQFAGLNLDILNDGTNFVQLTAFRGFDIADSFKGVAVMPFADTNGDGIPDGMNSGAYISRFQGQENIGDMNLVGLGFSRQEENGIKWFGSLGWTRTEPNANFNPMGLGGLLYDATPVMRVTDIKLDDDGNFAGVGMKHDGDYIKSANWNEERNGYSIYVGLQVPAPLGKAGLEYNYGSRFWTPFTQAQDDVVGSKLATRGHAGEAYYIFDINPNMFIKLGGIYYDYQYTGSGSPVGLPKKVKDIQNGSEYSMFPVLDKAWDVNAALTVKF